MDTTSIKTPLGVAVIIGDARGVAKIYLTDEPVALSAGDSPVLEEASRQLTEYFEGQRKSFTFKLNPSGTDFQKTIWSLLQHIPYGRTRSYQELSATYGDPKAIRAVASANAKNPLWIVVPCHRIIGSDGSLTGYAGGLWRKQWLLQHEQPIKQQSLNF